jgi:hypothetical protein
MEYNYIKPPHYDKGGKKVWQMMVDIWGEEAFIKFCEMNAFKYRMRLGEKPDQSIDDEIGKAKWYEDKAQELRAKNTTNIINSASSSYSGTYCGTSISFNAIKNPIINGLTKE